MATYDETLSETINCSEQYTKMSPDFDDTLTEPMTFLDVQSQITRAFPMALSDTVNVTPAALVLFQLGGIINELISIADARAALFIGTHIVSDGISLTDLMTAGIPASLSDSMTITDASAAQDVVQIFEQFGIGETLLAAAKKGVTVTEMFSIVESLGRFFEANITETLAIVETVIRRMWASLALSDGVILSDAAARSLILRVVVPEGITLTHTQALQALYKPTLREHFEIRAAYLAPGDNFLTWAVNTATGAVTEYHNFVFNSFAPMGRKYLAASADGLYELNGADDEGDSIIAAIKSGWLQFGGSRFTSFRDAYIGMNGEGNMYLRLETGDGKAYVYKIVAKDMQTTKVHFGRGLRARYFSFELYNDGQDFDLDNIEFLPIVSQRRI